MSLLEKFALFALANVDPESAHDLSLAALRMKLAPSPRSFRSGRLETSFAGLRLPNPLGLAAGYDKNAVAVTPLLRAGFGFIEVGGVTPLPQFGNPKPRLFRLRRDQAAINRFGFNSDGAEAISRRLQDLPRSGIVGLNIGANKGSRDIISDFAKVLVRCGSHVDFATINVSSPNTENLRDLQEKLHLRSLLDRVMEARSTLPSKLPIFLKVSPDLEPHEVRSIADVAMRTRIAGMIATNTTVSRESLLTPGPHEAGGLSGQPLLDRSTRILAQLYDATGGKLPLVGVGGVASAENAYQKITAGASAVQLYTALAYRGLSLVEDILTGLDGFLERDGYSSIAEATGTRVADWL